MFSNDDAPKWLKVGAKLIYSTAVEAAAKDFYGIFIEPYYVRECVHIDLREFPREDTMKFVNALDKLCKKSDKVIYIFKRQK